MKLLRKIRNRPARSVRRSSPDPYRGLHLAPTQASREALLLRLNR